MVDPLLAHAKVVFDIATLVNRLISSVSTFYENGKVLKELLNKMQLYEEYIEDLRRSNITQQNEKTLQDMQGDLENLKDTISSIAKAHDRASPRAMIGASNNSLTLENAIQNIKQMIIRVERLVIKPPYDPLYLCTDREGIQTEPPDGNSNNDSHSLHHSDAPSSSRPPPVVSEISMRTSLKNKFKSAGKKIIIIHRMSKHHHRGILESSKSSNNFSQVSSTLANKLSASDYISIKYDFKKLIHQAIQSGQPKQEIKRNLQELTRKWDGWKIDKSRVVYITNKEGIVKRLGKGQDEVFAAKLKVNDSNEVFQPVAVKVVKIMESTEQEKEAKLIGILRSIMMALMFKHHCVVKTYGVWDANLSLESTEVDNTPSSNHAEDNPKAKLTINTKIGNDELDLDDESSEEGEEIVPSVKIVMERMDVDVGKAIKRRRIVDTNETRCRILSDVASALHYLHHKGFAHLDLKLENVLIRVDKRNRLVGFAKLADFGLSRKIARQKLLESLNRSTIVPGTILYQPPEVLQHLSIETKYDPSTAIDVWSFGIMICKLLAPSKFELNIAQSMEYSQSSRLAKEAEEWADKIPIDLFRDIAKLCLAHNPDDRPSMLQVHLCLQCVVKPGEIEPKYKLLKPDTINKYAISLFADPCTQEEVSSARILLECGNRMFRQIENLKNRNCSPVPEFHLLFNEHTDYERKVRSFLENLKDGTVKLYEENSICHEHSRTPDQSLPKDFIELENEARDKESDPDLSMRLGDYFDQKKNFSEAFKWYEHAHNKGDMRAAVKIGKYYRDGRTEKKTRSHDEKAVKFFETAAYSENDSRGCACGKYLLSQAYHTGQGIEADSKKRIDLLHESSGNGCVKACLRLGEFYLDQKENVNKGLWLLSQAIKGGSNDACWRMADHYQYGRGVKKSVETALNLIQFATRDGEFTATWCFYKKNLFSFLPL